MWLSEIIERSSVPVPWAEGENIPWNDPGFSKRMLDEHLSQGKLETEDSGVVEKITTARINLGF